MFSIGKKGEKKTDRGGRGGGQSRVVHEKRTKGEKFWKEEEEIGRSS